MHRVTGSVTSRISGSTGAHRLRVAEMPSHTHHYESVGGIYHGNRLPNWQHARPGPRLAERASTPATTSTGGSQPHSHSAGALRVASSFTGTALDMRLAYVDVIVAVKD